MFEIFWHFLKYAFHFDLLLYWHMMKNDALSCSPYELEVDKFAELWTAYEHECKATVAIGRMEISVVVDNIANKCHMTSVRVAGVYFVSVELVTVMVNVIIRT